MTTATGPTVFQVDGADRRVAVLYALAVACTAGILVLFSDPRLLGPVSWGWWLASGMVCAALSTVMPIRRQAVGAAVVCPLFWLAGASWVAYGYAHDPFWPPQYWAGGAGLAGICMLLAGIYATPTDFGLPAQTGVPPAGDGVPAAAADEWGTVIAAATKGKVAGVVTREVREWDTGCGYSAFLTLPGDGSTDETLQPYQAAIAAVLDVPHGGGVTVFPDDDGGARAIRVDVLMTDAMAADLTYPGLAGSVGD